jgi:hypothetical protein
MELASHIEGCKLAGGALRRRLGSLTQLRRRCYAGNLLHESSEVLGFGQRASAGATNTDDDDAQARCRSEIQQPQDEDRSPHYDLT